MADLKSKTADVVIRQKDCGKLEPVFCELHGTRHTNLNSFKKHRYSFNKRHPEHEKITLVRISNGILARTSLNERERSACLEEEKIAKHGKVSQMENNVSNTSQQQSSIITRNAMSGERELMQAVENFLAANFSFAAGKKEEFAKKSVAFICNVALFEAKATHFIKQGKELGFDSTIIPAKKGPLLEFVNEIDIFLAENQEKQDSKEFAELDAMKLKCVNLIGLCNLKEFASKKRSASKTFSESTTSSKTSQSIVAVEKSAASSGIASTNSQSVHGCNNVVKTNNNNNDDDCDDNYDVNNNEESDSEEFYGPRRKVAKKMATV